MTDLMIAPGEGVVLARPSHVGAEYFPLFLRRKDAARYVFARYGFCTAASLNKLASIGGGPEFHKCGRITIYTREALDAWVLAKLRPAQKSNSDTRAA